jgi:hypothetical protein
VGSQPAILVVAWIAYMRTQCSLRTARIDRQSCMLSSHAPRTRNPEARVRENRKTESRKTDSTLRWPFYELDSHDVSRPSKPAIDPF